MMPPGSMDIMCPPGPSQPGPQHPSHGVMVNNVMQSRQNGPPLTVAQQSQGMVVPQSPGMINVVIF